MKLLRQRIRHMPAPFASAHQAVNLAGYPAIQALALYNLDISRNPEMMVGVPA